PALPRARQRVATPRLLGARLLPQAPPRLPARAADGFPVHDPALLHRGAAERANLAVPHEPQRPPGREGETGFMLDRFEEFDIATAGTTIHGRRGGQGPPVLLLHGMPQTHLMRHRVAPQLAEPVTLVATDP